MKIDDTKTRTIFGNSTETYILEYYWECVGVGLPSKAVIEQYGMTQKECTKTINKFVRLGILKKHSVFKGRTFYCWNNKTAMGRRIAMLFSFIVSREE